MRNEFDFSPALEHLDEFNLDCTIDSALEAFGDIGLDLNDEFDSALEAIIADALEAYDNDDYNEFYAVVEEFEEVQTIADEDERTLRRKKRLNTAKKVGAALLATGTALAIGGKIRKNIKNKRAPQSNTHSKKPGGGSGSKKPGGSDKQPEFVPPYQRQNVYHMPTDQVEIIKPTEIITPRRTGSKPPVFDIPQQFESQPYNVIPNPKRKDLQPKGLPAPIVVEAPAKGHGTFKQPYNVTPNPKRKDLQPKGLPAPIVVEAPAKGHGYNIPQQYKSQSYEPPIPMPKNDDGPRRIIGLLPEKSSADSMANKARTSAEQERERNIAKRLRKNEERNRERERKLKNDMQDNIDPVSNTFMLGRKAGGHAFGSSDGGKIGEFESPKSYKQRRQEEAMNIELDRINPSKNNSIPLSLGNDTFLDDIPFELGEGSNKPTLKEMQWKINDARRTQKWKKNAKFEEFRDGGRRGIM